VRYQCFEGAEVASAPDEWFQLRRNTWPDDVQESDDEYEWRRRPYFDDASGLAVVVRVSI
jgi:hypothetical protein